MIGACYIVRFEWKIGFAKSFLNDFELASKRVISKNNYPKNDIIKRIESGLYHIYL
jgi:hypothetical protein